MNREIKFRIWSNSMKRWLCEDSQYLQMDGKKVHAAPWSTMEWNIPSDEYVIQQFTGLKDKNGMEIFEGDIVKLKDHISKVIFDMGMFYIEIFYSDANYKNITPVSEVDNIIEVIGNIFENKEIL